MNDKELEELRKEVKEKEEQKKITEEKIKLRKKLNEDKLSSKLLKIGKNIFDKF